LILVIIGNETNYLRSAVVEFPEANLPTHGIELTFVYCNHKQNLSQRVEYFVGAIVRQLLEQKETVPKEIQTLYERYRKKGTTPTRSEYFDILQSLSNECTKIYLVVDALDECINENGEMIWKDLLTPLRKLVTNLRLLCTLRHVDDIGQISPGSICIEIRASDADLRTYVQAQVNSNNILSKFCKQDSNLQNDILQVVVSKAEGM
jgi:hypothetical protein